MARMLRTSRWLRELLLWRVAGGSVEPGSGSRLLAGSQTVTDVLHQMSDRADVIFMGQVLAVRLPEAGSETSGIVEIEFRVDQAIRGCAAGTPYILREWGGLWAGGSQRYRVGQRSADASACAQRRWTELAGRRARWGYSDSAGLDCGSAGGELRSRLRSRLSIFAGLESKLPRAVSYRTGPCDRRRRWFRQAQSQANSGRRDRVWYEKQRGSDHRAAWQRQSKRRVGSWRRRPRWMSSSGC